MTDTVSMKEYVDERLDAQQKAVDKAEQQLRERLAGMNEFRDTLRDQAGKFVTRDEITLLREASDSRLHGLELWKANMEGRLLIVGSVIAVTTIAINHLLRLAFGA